MRWFQVPLLTVAIACSKDEGGKDEDTTETTETSDTNETADTTETSDTTETMDSGAVDTTDPLTLPGTLLTLTNGSFEDTPLEVGGGIFQDAGGGAPYFTIPGWGHYLGAPTSGFGVARPTVASFAAVEPLAAPADGNTVAYMDSRNGLPGEASDIHLTHWVPQVVQAGQTVYARLAFGSRTDGVGLHTAVKLQLRMDDAIVAETPVTMPAAGTWTDVTVSYTLPEGAVDKEVQVGAVAYQPDLNGYTYWQTYVDNLRISID